MIYVTAQAKTFLVTVCVTACKNVAKTSVKTFRNSSFFIEENHHHHHHIISQFHIEITISQVHILITSRYKVSGHEDMDEEGNQKFFEDASNRRVKEKRASWRKGISINEKSGRTSGGAEENEEGGEFSTLGNQELGDSISTSISNSITVSGLQPAGFSQSTLASSLVTLQMLNRVNSNTSPDGGQLLGNSTHSFWNFKGENWDYPLNVIDKTSPVFVNGALHSQHLMTAGRVLGMELWTWIPPVIHIFCTYRLLVFSTSTI
jgi:hypothetical protein